MKRPRTSISQSDQEERLTELARIFATGLRRLWAARGSAPKLSENLASPRLEVPAETVLSVTTAVNGIREPKLRRER